MEIGGDPKPWRFDASEHPIGFCDIWVDKINTKGKIDRRLLRCNEAFGELYREIPFSKELESSRSFKWFGLTKIVCVESNKLEMYFKDDGVIIFQNEHAHKIALLIIEHVLTILTYSEYPEIKIDGFYLQEFTPGVQCALLRYRARAFGRNSTVSPEILEVLSDFQHSNSNSIDISDLKLSADVIDDFLFAIIVDPRIKYIFISKAYSEQSVWNAVARCLYRNSTIQGISVGEKYDDTFSLLADALQTKHSSLQKIEFVNCGFTLNAADDISKMISAGKLKSISFVKAINKISVPSFMNTVAKSKNFNQITSLTIANQRKIIIPELLKYCSSITSLRLENVSIDISDIILAINNAENIHLEKLDLSNNVCRKKMPRNCHFGGAKTVIMESVGFTVVSMVSVIFHAGISQNVTSLSLSHASIDTGDWNGVYFRLKELKDLGLTELNWNGNVLLPHFFAFLGNNPSLSILSLKGCPSTEGIVQHICQIIKKTDSLTALNIAGNSENSLQPEAVIEIFKSLAVNRSIKVFDISRNKIGSNGLSVLTDTLMANRVIENINIEKCSVTSADAWSKFFGTLLGRGRSLKMTWPDREMQVMLENSNITEDDITEYKKKLALIGRGDPSVPIPQETITKVSEIEHGTNEVQSKKKGSARKKREKADEQKEQLMLNMKNIGLSGIVVPPIEMTTEEECIKLFTIDSIIQRIKTN